MTTKTVTITQQSFELHPLKAIFWKEQNVLLMADLHLGKARHFRKEGFPVPQEVGDQNYEILINLLLHYRPARVIFLGDLFHSDYNEEWTEISDLVHQFSSIRFDLVQGNHDILTDYAYAKANIRLFKENLLIDNILLSHEPLASIPAGTYNLAGHIHPCVWLHGSGRQRMRLPCFHFGKTQGLLPAFGAFTGMAEVKVRKEDQVFVLADNAVLKM
ncbi:MAG: ligase-associated DNA damage response endonuclease PdeM [Saprospiraceae bacterium]